MVRHSRVLDLLKNGPAKIALSDEIEHCDAVLVLGEDVTNVLPLMALRLRQVGPPATDAEGQRASRFRCGWIMPFANLLRMKRGRFS